MRTRRFLFLCGAPRSGTTLLLNLLDGHSQINAIPHENRFLAQWNRHKTQGDTRRFARRDVLFTPDFLQFVDEGFRETMERYIEKTYGRKRIWKKIFDWESAADCFMGQIPDGREPTVADLYQGLAAMYGQQTGQADKPLAAEKRPLDNEISAVHLAALFPEARFIHILRDPRTRYISSKTRRILPRRGYAPNLYGKSFAQVLAEIAMVSLRLAQLNRKVLGERYLVIRFESLMRDTEGVMQEVAAHLGVEFEESLLSQTTYNGIPHGPVSSMKGGTVSQQQGGVADHSTRRLEKFHRDTSQLERRLLSYLCAEAAAPFAYDLEPCERLTMRDLLGPIRREDPFHILGNRHWMLKHLCRPPRTIAVTQLYQQILEQFDQGIEHQD
ncbi:MAG: sulfotransferase [Magnetococcales bacterium]|nr:sulfotransferase [Magnetococcales bacterium]